MGIELYWDNSAQTVMLCEFGRQWTWDDLDTVLIKIKKITDKAAPQIIAAIVDLRAGGHLPGGSIFSPGAVNQAKKILRMGEGATGPVVVVGGGTLIKAAYNLMRGIDPNAVSNVSFASTLDEARDLLKQQHYEYVPASK